MIMQFLTVGKQFYSLEANVHNDRDRFPECSRAAAAAANDEQAMTSKYWAQAICMLCKGRKKLG